MEATPNAYVGGASTGFGNTIAFNGEQGILLKDAEPPAVTNSYIAGNSIHSNGGLGIDLSGDGVTENDEDDHDTGPNGLQNFPLLLSAEIPEVAVAEGESALDITGTLNSTPNGAFTIDFFASDECDPSDHGEGQEFIAFPFVQTDAEGNAEFSFGLTAPVAPGRFITATAQNLDSDQTSEFSLCIVVVAPATPTPTPSPTPAPSATPAPTPTPTPTAGPVELVQGDVDCDGDEDDFDALKQLLFVAHLGVQQEAGCPEIGSEVASLFGDVDCDLDVDALDAIKLLQHLLGFEYQRNEPCPDIGQALLPAA